MMLKNSVNRLNVLISEVPLAIKYPLETLLQMNKFSKNLRRLMQERRISSKELAVETGLSPSSISEYLSSKRLPVVGDSLIKIAKCLDVSLDELITGSVPDRRPGDFMSGIKGGLVEVHQGLYQVIIKKVTETKGEK